MANAPSINQLLKVGREIRRRREALGLTLDQLSDRSGITPNYIGTIENGKRDASMSTLNGIAVGLGVPLGELLGTTLCFHPSTIELARLFDQTTGEVQTAILVLLRTSAKLRRR
ncbi:MAG: helix-turn-helix transcriptional regulator [Polyangiaceae bacterium]|nr:helix-turn-helix transcriptional regulator [Polyangiaceae bacterium]